MKGNLEKSRMLPSLKLFFTPEGRVASSCDKLSFLYCNVELVFHSSQFLRQFWTNPNLALFVEYSCFLFAKSRTQLKVMKILTQFYLKIFLKVRFSDIQLITLWQESYLMQIGYHEQLVRDPFDHL